MEIIEWASNVICSTAFIYFICLIYLWTTNLFIISYHQSKKTRNLFSKKLNDNKKKFKPANKMKLYLGLFIFMQILLICVTTFYWKIVNKNRKDTMQIVRKNDKNKTCQNNIWKVTELQWWDCHNTFNLNINITNNYRQKVKVKLKKIL